MTSDERIDIALDLVLIEAGSALSHYTSPRKARMRLAMRKVLDASYLDGSNAHFRASQDSKTLIGCVGHDCAECKKRNRHMICCNDRRENMIYFNDEDPDSWDYVSNDKDDWW